MHTHYIEDSTGDLVDIVPFCCDACHHDWCADNGVPYAGWSGCNEGGDSQEFCASCGVYCGGGTGEDSPCDCQCENIVVNRILSTDGKKCEHGNWIQVPVRFLEHFKFEPQTKTQVEAIIEQNQAHQDATKNINIGEY